MNNEARCSSILVDETIKPISLLSIFEISIYLSIWSLFSSFKSTAARALLTFCVSLKTKAFFLSPDSSYLVYLQAVLQHLH